MKERPEVGRDGNPSSGKIDHFDLSLALTRQFWLHRAAASTCKAGGSDRLRFERSSLNPFILFVRRTYFGQFDKL